MADMGSGDDGDRTTEPSRALLRPRGSSRAGGRRLGLLRRLELRLGPLPLDDALLLLDTLRTVSGSAPSTTMPSAIFGVLRFIRSSGDMGTGDLGDRLPALVE